tara:strand:+ start:482 stop:1258 length:777 start_codon:yes stop_codon:yes gene_type:complete
MQPRLNIALKACRSAADIINNIYKSKDQDELRSYDDLGQILYINLIEQIAESYPFNGKDCLGPTNIDLSNIKDRFTHMNFKSHINDENKFIWVINPIDSYENFVNKIPIFNITISIFLNGVVQAALIYNPVLDELVTAIRGEGALYENKKIRNTSVNNNKILYVIDETKLTMELNKILDGNERKLGSKSTELIYMAEGKLDLTIYSEIDVWDSAAGLLICKESGVMVTDHNGEDNIYECRSLLAARESLHKMVLKKLS